jgi:hypothetical protein
MKKIYFLATCFSLLTGFVQAQNKLALLYSSAGMEYGKASAVDLDTNYIEGFLFQNTVNVSPNSTINLVASGGATEGGLVKYNRKGQLVWAKRFGGATSSEAPHGIDTDNQKNIYVTGYFGSTAITGSVIGSFNPAGGGTVSTQGDEDCFVAKYDQNGNYLWAFGLGNVGANTQERAWDIAVEPNGNLYVVGGFQGTMNFNPLGASMTYSLSTGPVGLFIAKYNTNGICQWVTIIDAQCTSVFNEGYATCDLDNLGNLYVAGNFRGASIEFNPLGTSSTLTSSGQTDIFISKYNTSNGVLGYVKRIGGTLTDVVSPGSLRCDNNGNPYFTGRLPGTGNVDFDPSPAILNVSNSALYLASYDINGNVRYAIGMNSGAGDGGHRVAFDSNNNVFIAGWMNGTASFGTNTLTAFSGMADNFIAKYNNNLTTCSWAFNFGGGGSSANNIVAGMVVDQEDNPIITGQLYGANADIDPSANINNFSSVGQNDCFVIKYTNSGSLWTSATSSGLVSALNCNLASSLGSLVFNTPASGVVISVPYSGGNGGPYNAQLINSVGVSGLSASVSAGNFSLGTGTLNYTISGIPTTIGTGSFSFNLGGQTCTYTFNVTDNNVASLGELENKSSFHIYPNPTNGIINIQSAVSYNRIKVLNSLGCEVLTANSTSVLDISYLTPGIYVIELITKDNEVIFGRKVLKN